MERPGVRCTNICLGLRMILQQGLFWLCFLQVLVTWLKIRSQKVISNQQFSGSILVSRRVDVFLPFGGTFTFQPLVFGGVFPSNGYGWACKMSYPLKILQNVWCACKKARGIFLIEMFSLNLQTWKNDGMQVIPPHHQKVVKICWWYHPIKKALLRKYQFLFIKSSWMSS